MPPVTAMLLNMISYTKTNQCLQFTHHIPGEWLDGGELMNGWGSEKGEGQGERAGDFEWVRDFNCIRLPWKNKENSRATHVSFMINFFFFFLYLS